MSAKLENPKLDDQPQSNTVKDPDQWVSGEDPMTGAQASYITTLAEQLHAKPPPAEMTKAEASKKIDEMKQKLDKAAS